jgi:hypothetical protein
MTGHTRQPPQLLPIRIHNGKTALGEGGAPTSEKPDVLTIRRPRPDRQIFGQRCYPLQVATVEPDGPEIVDLSISVGGRRLENLAEHSKDMQQTALGRDVIVSGANRREQQSLAIR